MDFKKLYEIMIYNTLIVFSSAVFIICLSASTADMSIINSDYLASAKCVAIKCGDFGIYIGSSVTLIYALKFGEIKIVKKINIALHEYAHHCMARAIGVKSEYVSGNDFVAISASTRWQWSITALAPLVVFTVGFTIACCSVLFDIHPVLMVVTMFVAILFCDAGLPSGYNTDDPRPPDWEHATRHGSPAVNNTMVLVAILLPPIVSVLLARLTS